MKAAAYLQILNKADNLTLAELRDVEYVAERILIHAEAAGDTISEDEANVIAEDIQELV